MAATTAQQQQQQQQAPPLSLPPARSRTPQPTPVPVQQALPTTPQMSTRPSFGVATPPPIAQPLPQTQGSYHPSLLSTPPQASSTPTRMPSPPRPPATARRPSVPITQAFIPASQPVQPPTRPGSPAESLKRKAPPEPYPRPQKRPVERPPNAPNVAPQVYFAGAGGKPRESSPIIDLSNENHVGDRRASEPQAPVTEVKRKRDERMRRTMRDDIARLMYACGDVIEPDVDTVDYVEDLVVDFLADMCRPSPLIRTNPQSTYQAHPLTAPILRHRLSSSPSMRKYLDRFDELSAKSVEIAAQRRMMRGTENPNDLVNIVGKDYLEVDEEGKEVGAAGDAKRKRGRPRTKGVGEKDVKGVGRGRKKGNGMAKKIKPPA
ncbi:hypothetical protein BCR39DRAFT_522359 [Naematelia encephala]|uniref:Transcription initiation factor TFIID subunit 13 n=1 Tax=Naematelia encephala TaxID=71784 RepID=A0A1Y2BDW6_9TREE|nr:hypothetical protein BCR39DRAFT_522359 [Naematelia encephala]